MKVLVTSGGTAGHIYPAVTVAERLVDAHDEVTFVGTPQGLEARLVPEAGIPFRGLSASGFDRSRPLSLITAGGRIISSALKAWWWMGRERPDCVLGFGAYVSLPVGLAAVLRRVPIVLHEQNSVPGMATRILSRWAKWVGVTYEESARYLAHPERVEHTGNPVRESVLEASRSEGRTRLGLAEDDLVLLAFGGSRGARHINEALLRNRERLLSLEKLVVVHVTGPAEVEAVRARLDGDDPHAARRWRVYDYLPGMGDAIAAADLVVSRAGATTIAELTALGVAAVVVPYPYATDDHQTKNATSLVDHGAALCVADKELDSERFADELMAILSDPERRATMSAASRELGRRDAAERVIALARSAARGPQSTRSHET